MIAPNLNHDHDEMLLNLSLISSDLDNFWMFFGVVLVFIMQIGFSMLEVGSVNIKNTKSILAKNLIDASIITLVWWCVGHGTAFESNDTNKASGFYGSGKYFQSFSLPQIHMTNEMVAPIVQNNATGQLNGVSELVTDPKLATSIMATHKTVYDSSAFFMYQWAFAINACTIVAGAVAERIKIEAYFVYAVIFGTIIYPPVVHWVWSAHGWVSILASNTRSDIAGLQSVGLIDFAGSGVVHMTGGLVAVVGAAILGPRAGRFNERGEVVSMPQQSTTFQVLGTMLMWVGWYGFNACSTLGLVHGQGVVGVKTVFNTTMSAASACLSSALLLRWANGVVDIAPLCNGLLGGLVAITAGCATVDAAGAIIIGVVSGPVYFLGSKLIVRLKIDDVVDAAAVHFCCGLWGLLAAAIFSTPLNFRYVYRDAAHESCGVLYSCKSHSGAQFAVTLLFIIVHFLYVGGVAVLTFMGMSFCGILRETADTEELGMDISRHNGEAYQISTITTLDAAMPTFEFPEDDSLDNNNDDNNPGEGAATIDMGEFNGPEDADNAANRADGDHTANADLGTGVTNAAARLQREQELSAAPAVPFGRVNAELRLPVAVNT